MLRAADGTYYLASGQGLVESQNGTSWSQVPNFTSRVVGLAMGNGTLYAADQWSTSYYSAATSNIGKVTTIPPPAALPSGYGAPYLDYDSAHHVLYSSNYAAGTWRLVTP
jgi:hypothetical protein